MIKSRVEFGSHQGAANSQRLVRRGKFLLTRFDLSHALVEDLPLSASYRVVRHAQTVRPLNSILDAYAG